MPGMALALFAAPVYLSAAVAAIRRRPLAYAVTAKGRLSTGDTLSSFRLHLCWAAVAAALLVASIVLGHDYVALRLWSGLSLLAGLGPPTIAALSHVAHRLSAKRTVRPAATVRATARPPRPATVRATARTPRPATVRATARAPLAARLDAWSRP